MQNINEILSELGITIPEDKQTEFNRKVAENYKTIAEHEKKIAKVEADRDKWKGDAETAAETLKQFESVDVAAIQAQLNEYKKKAETAETEYKKQIEQRDFADALKSELDGIKFTSEYAKKSVMAEIQNAGLKMVDGKIIGLHDMIETIKKADAGAFVDEEQQNAEKNKASFTTSMGKGSGTKYANKEEILKIKDATERQEAIASHLDWFAS